MKSGNRYTTDYKKLSKNAFNIQAKSYDIDKNEKYASNLCSTVINALTYISFDNFLDLVCGIGEILNLLKNLYPNVALNGINISDEMLKIARDKFPLNAKLYLCDAKYLTYKNESFY